MIRKLTISLLIPFVVAIPVWAQVGKDGLTPISVSNPRPVEVENSITATAAGVTLANSTSVSGANSSITSATTITFTAPSTNFSVGTTPGGADLYLALTGTATTSSGLIPTGYFYTYNGPAVSSISIKADSSAGTYSVIAH